MKNKNRGLSIEIGRKTGVIEQRRDEKTIVYAAFCVHKKTGGGIVLSTLASAWVSISTDINYVRKAGAGGAIRYMNGISGEYIQMICLRVA